MSSIVSATEWKNSRQNYRSGKAGPELREIQAITAAAEGCDINEFLPDENRSGTDVGDEDFSDRSWLT